MNVIAPIGYWALVFLLPPVSTLDNRLSPLIQSHQGKVAVAVKHLDSGESFFWNADDAMPTASLIKFMIMLEVYLQASEGKLKLSDPVRLREQDKVPGSGILSYHFSEGATFSLRDAVHLMIVFSDNTATNLVLDRVGIAAVNQRLQHWSLPLTRVNAQVFRGDTTSVDPVRTKKFGLGSTSARETVLLLEKVHQGKIISPEVCKEMLGHMKQCTDKGKIKRYLPANLVVAHKSGTVSNARTDAGILYLPTGPVAICVLTDQNQDESMRDENEGNVLIGRIAQQVYEHFASMQKKKSP